MDYKKYTINIEEYALGGASCSKSKIEWDPTTCAAIKCEKNNGKIIEVVIPDDCDERCFWVTYTCLDKCTDCDPIRMRICPCEGPEDCPDGCTDCIEGICVSKCEDWETCDEDTDICNECDDEHPCTNGKQCVGGDCKCPPSKPYTNSKGDCVPCLEDTCPPGEICTKDGCKPPVCEEGVWHAGKQECVECINSGHCDGPHECCNDDNECDCCPGFVRNPISGECEPPPCVTDDDCPACTYCDGTDCVPIDCGPGMVCIPEEDGCVPECDCQDPDCDGQSDACVAYNSSTCYCKECSGSCANGESCGDGCYCNDDFECVPNPCANVPCVNGSDCGEGCGCNEETHECEPCASAECGDECDNLLGCECLNGSTCADVKGCDGPCDGYGYCGPDCACDNGRCVPCADFSCATTECSDHPECECTGSGCDGDPDFCGDVFDNSVEECGVTAELTLKDGCMCPGITAYATPHIISKGLVPAGSNEIRHLVSVAMRLAKGTANSWDEIKNLHLLDEVQYEDIADNDTPLSGTLDLTITEFYQPQVWSNGAWVNQGGVVSRVLPTSGSYSFAGIARKENIRFNAGKIGTGINVVAGQSQDKIVRYEIMVKANSLKFPNNCTYAVQELPPIRLDGGTYKSVTDSLDQLTSQFSYTDLFINAPNGNYNLGGKFAKWEDLSSSSKRDPLFVWYRSEDDVYTDSDIIRKIYVNADAANYYKDSLFGPEKFLLTKQNLVDPEGRVFGDMYYKVTNDCACNDKAKDFGNLKWCSPESMAIASITFSDCNKKVEIKSDIGRPCSVNWDLREHDLHPDDNNNAFKARHQAKYHLIIMLEDGSIIDIPYLWRETGVPTPGLYRESDNTALKAFTQTFTSPIIGLTMELRYGTSTEVVCDWEKDVPAPPTHVPTYTRICEPNSNNIKYRFQTAPNHITNIVAVGGTVVAGSGYIEIVAAQGTTVTANFTFSDYCPYTMQLNEFCCDTLTVAFNVNQIPGPALDIVAELTATVTGGTLPYSVKYYRQLVGGTNELVGESSNSANNFKVLLSNPTPGLYFATASDGSGNCSKNSAVVSIEPRNQSDYPITITPTFLGCTYTGNVKITLPSQPDIINSKVYYKVNNGAEVYFTVTSQMAAAGFHLLPAIGQTITLVRLEIPNQSGPPTSFTLTGSATVPSNLNADIPVLSSFTINGVTSAVNICEGDSALLEFQGSPNAVVNVSGIAPILLNGSGYGSSTQTPVDTTTYTVESVTNSNGDCPGTQGVGLTRQIQVTPLPEITVVSDVCDGSGTFRTITFSNITSATDQLGNPLTVTGSSVTVNVATVTEVRVSYVLGICTARFTHFVLACGAPEITGDVDGPDKVCEGETATVTTSGVTGGTAPYSYNYYTNSNYNENYVLNQTTKDFLLASTDTVYVRVKDALGNIASIGSVAIQVAPLPTPNIIPSGDTGRITEVSENNYEITDDVVTAVFKTALNYVSYAWQVAGSYGGTMNGSGSTFSLNVADISGTITLQVTVTSADGCVGTEIISITVESADPILESDELLFTTSSFKLYKVAVSPSSIGVPALLCGAGNPAASVAMRGNGQLITANGNNLYIVDVLGGCGNTPLGTMSHGNSLGMLSADVIVAMNNNSLATYDINTSTANNTYYTISDGVNTYLPTGDIIRVGSTLYALARQYVSGVGGNKVLIAFTLNGSDVVTAFTNVGALPNQAGNPYGLARVGGVNYLIFADGKLYNLNTTTPGTSTLIGTIIVPGGEAIWDVTNNF